MIPVAAMRYIILHCGNRDSLERDGVPFLSPTYEVTVINRYTKKPTLSTRTLYPGYLFIPSDSYHHFLQSPGRRGRVLSSGGVPYTVEAPSYQPPAPVIKPVFKVGDMVKIMSGPFIGVVGGVETVDGDYLTISTSLGYLSMPSVLARPLGETFSDDYG